jgi:hypothetical protein
MNTLRRNTTFSSARSANTTCTLIVTPNIAHVPTAGTTKRSQYPQILLEISIKQQLKLQHAETHSVLQLCTMPLFLKKFFPHQSLRTGALSSRLSINSPLQIHRQ